MLIQEVGEGVEVGDDLIVGILAPRIEALLLPITPLDQPRPIHAADHTPVAMLQFEDEDCIMFDDDEIDGTPADTEVGEDEVETF